MSFHSLKKIFDFINSLLLSCSFLSSLPHKKINHYAQQPPTRNGNRYRTRPGSDKKKTGSGPMDSEDPYSIYEPYILLGYAMYNQTHFDIQIEEIKFWEKIKVKKDHQVEIKRWDLWMCSWVSMNLAQEKEHVLELWQSPFFFCLRTTHKIREDERRERLEWVCFSCEFSPLGSIYIINARITIFFWNICENWKISTQPMPLSFIYTFNLHKWQCKKQL